MYVCVCGRYRVCVCVHMNVCVYVGSGCRVCVCVFNQLQCGNNPKAFNSRRVNPGNENFPAVRINYSHIQFRITTKIETRQNVKHMIYISFNSKYTSSMALEGRIMAILETHENSGYQGISNGF